MDAKELRDLLERTIRLMFPADTTAKLMTEIDAYTAAVTADLRARLADAEGVLTRQEWEELRVFANELQLTIGTGWHLSPITCQVMGAICGKLVRGYFDRHPEK
jgi:hypothetical protein